MPLGIGGRASRSPTLRRLNSVRAVFGVYFVLEPLRRDLILSRRTLVAGSVEIDHVAGAGVLEQRFVAVYRLFTDRWKFNVTVGSGSQLLAVQYAVRSPSVTPGSQQTNRRQPDYFGFDSFHLFFPFQFSRIAVC